VNTLRKFLGSLRFWSEKMLVRIECYQMSANICWHLFCNSSIQNDVNLISNYEHLSKQLKINSIIKFMISLTSISFNLVSIEIKFRFNNQLLCIWFSYRTAVYFVHNIWNRNLRRIYICQKSHWVVVNTSISGLSVLCQNINSHRWSQEVKNEVKVETWIKLLIIIAILQ
jgi:hypothetical protein